MRQLKWQTPHNIYKADSVCLPDEARQDSVSDVKNADVAVIFSLRSASFRLHQGTLPGLMPSKNTGGSSEQPKAVGRSQVPVKYRERGKG